MFPLKFTGISEISSYVQTSQGVFVHFDAESCSFIIAAEQKARLTYDNILRFTDDADVRDPIRFLRAREVVHYQRFGEALRLTTDKLDSKNFYAFNPEFDKK